MLRFSGFTKGLLFLGVLLFLFLPADAQKRKNKAKKAAPTGRPVMWEKTDVAERDLFLGPGGEMMRPDLSRITFLKKDKTGTSLKYRIKDAAGRTWVAKIDREAQPETAATRLVWALGYKSEINYLVPTLKIPGIGAFKNARLEARPDDVERLDRWKWKSNRFSGTREFQGLKIMMALLNNWDLKDSNTVILRGNDELQYVVSDLGATFGKYGSNKLPIFWRLGRSKNKPAAYNRSEFIDDVKKGQLKFAISANNRSIFKGITTADGRWLADLLLRLSDRQIEDAFRAANYTPAEIKLLTQAVKNRIDELDRLTGQNNLARAE